MLWTIASTSRLNPPAPAPGVRPREIRSSRRSSLRAIARINQDIGTVQIASLSRRQVKAQRIAERVAKRMDFGV